MSPHESGPERPFEEPWQAKAFALAVHLSERGLFTWPEWTEIFAEMGREPQFSKDVSEATDYWRRWVLALERVMVLRGHATPATIDRLRAAWDEAFHATPHAQPVALPNELTRAIMSTE